MLKALAALWDDPGVVPSTHMGSQAAVTPVLGNPDALVCPYRQHVPTVYAHECRQTIHTYKFKMNRSIRKPLTFFKATQGGRVVEAGLALIRHVCHKLTNVSKKHDRSYIVTLDKCTFIFKPKYYRYNLAV